MKRFFIAIGILLVISGVVIVLVVGGSGGFQNIKDTFKRDLSSADAYRTVELTDKNIKTLEIFSDSFTVYVRPTDSNEILVKYVSDLPKGADIVISESDNKITVEQRDDNHSWFWVHLWDFNKRFMVIEVPATVLAEMDVYANVSAGGFSMDGVSTHSVIVTVDAGEVSLSNVHTGNVSVSVSAGNVTVSDMTAYVVKADIDAGKLDCKVDCQTLKLTCDAGSIDFRSNASVIEVENSAGSVNGVVIGNVGEYNVDVDISAGRTNLVSDFDQSRSKSLSVEVDAGNAMVSFELPQ